MFKQLLKKLGLWLLSQAAEEVIEKVTDKKTKEQK